MTDTSDFKLPYTGTIKDSDPYLRGKRDMLTEITNKLQGKTSGYAGMDRGRVGVELIYCLPDRFVASYELIFNTALTGQLSAVSGTGIERDKSAGRATGKANGIVLGSESGLQAQGGGKKWRPSHTFLGPDDALAIKAAVDKALDDLSLRIDREMEDMANRRKDGEKGKLKRGGRKCSGSRCGRFMQPEWRFCPGCGTKV